MLPVFDQRTDRELNGEIELGSVKENYDVVITYKKIRFYCHSIYLSNNSIVFRQCCNKNSKWEKQFTSRIKKRKLSSAESLDAIDCAVEEESETLLEINYDDGSLSSSLVASAHDFLEFLEALYDPSTINPKYEENSFFSHLEGILELADHFQVQWILNWYDRKLPKCINTQGAQTLWRLLYLCQIRRLMKSKLKIVEHLCESGLSSMQYAGGVVWEKFWPHYDVEIMRCFTDFLILSLKKVEKQQEDRKWTPYCSNCQHSDYDLDSGSEHNDSGEEEQDAEDVDERELDQIEDELNDVRPIETTEVQRSSGVEENSYHYQETFYQYINRVKSEQEKIQRIAEARALFIVHNRSSPEQRE